MFVTDVTFSGGVVLDCIIPTRVSNILPLLMFVNGVGQNINNTSQYNAVQFSTTASSCSHLTMETKNMILSEMFTVLYLCGCGQGGTSVFICGGQHDWLKLINIY